MANFISLTDLKSNTAIQGNVDSALVTPFINTAQRLYILRILGTAQYESLESAIDTYTLTGLTGTNLTLQQKIKPALEYYTFYTAMPYLYAKFTNKSIVHQADNNAETVSEQFFDRLRKDVWSWAVFEENELLRFLRANKSLYPLWTEDYFSIYEVNSGATYNRTFFGGIEFDSSITWRKLPPDVV